MSRLDEIRERLRQKNLRDPLCGGDPNLPGDQYHKTTALADIEHLLSLVDDAREALKPFVAIYRRGMRLNRFSTIEGIKQVLKDEDWIIFRRAMAALKRMEKELVAK